METPIVDEDAQDLTVAPPLFFFFSSLLPFPQLRRIVVLERMLGI